MKTYFGIIGGLCLAFALWLFLRRLAVALSGYTATGHVVGFDKRTDDDADYYLPVVVFIDREGRERRFTSPAGNSHETPPIGAQVAVRYLGEPGSEFIESFLHMWGAPIGFAVLGLGGIFAYLR